MTVLCGRLEASQRSPFHSLTPEANSATGCSRTLTEMGVLYAGKTVLGVEKIHRRAS